MSKIHKRELERELKLGLKLAEGITKISMEDRADGVYIKAVHHDGTEQEVKVTAVFSEEELALLEKIIIRMFHAEG